MKITALVAALAGALLFPLGAAGALTVAHSFAGPDGQVPTAPLVQATDGFLYGTTQGGGNFTVFPPDGGGTVFRLDGAGHFTLLHVFNGWDGATPTSLIQGRDGFFYGTTRYQGVDRFWPGPGNGTIFRMDSAGNVTVLRSFPGTLEGGAQPGPIIQGADGALYGTAVGGVITLNYSSGFVYRFDPVTGDFRHLHDFVLTDGKDPSGPLFQGGDGFFYGTTVRGGPSNTGVVYKVDATGAFALLHAFDVNEGWNPKGGVIRASDGLLYGTTEGGHSYGTVFRLDTSGGNFAVMHRFDDYMSDGGKTQSGLVQARDGFLYGTAPYGGQPVTDPREGVVYRMDLAGNVTLVHTFTGPDGARPYASLLEAADGRLYGTTAVGGANGLGAVFALDPVGAVPPPPPPAAPAASFTGTPTSGFAPLEVAFMDTSTGNPTAWSWSFGDGATSTARNPSHTYVATGAYTVTLTASNAGGFDTATRTDYITVAPAPLVISGLTLSPATVHGGSPATGTVTLSGVAPPGGALVSLTSSDRSASTPPSVTVTEGASAATFGITTLRVKRTKTVTISATYNSSSTSAQLTLIR